MRPYSDSQGCGADEKKQNVEKDEQISSESATSRQIRRTHFDGEDVLELEIVDKEILSFIKRKYLKYTFNNKCIQYYDSKNCGKFCVAFIKMVKNRNNFKSFVNKFDFHNLKNNDKQIVKILKKFNID